jgi:hypothetical protein
MGWTALQFAKKEGVKKLLRMRGPSPGGDGSGAAAPATPPRAGGKRSSRGLALAFRLAALWFTWGVCFIWGIPGAMGGSWPSPGVTARPPA